MTDVLWFCHRCKWTGYLPSGVLHVCKPASDEEQP